MIKYLVPLSAGDEFRSLMAVGLKQLHSLVARRQILLYILPVGSRVNRLQPRWVLAFGFLWALCRHLT